MELKDMAMNVNLQRDSVTGNRKGETVAFNKNILKGILDVIPAQVFVHDKDGNLAYSNCEDLTSGKCESCSVLNNRKHNSIIANDKCQLIKEHSINNNIVIKADELIEIQDCTLGMSYANASKKLITDPDSGNTFTVTFLMDQTEQKAQEQEFIKTTQDAKLAQAAQEQFLANMSHELRTPIAGMTGLLEMLMLRTEDEESRLLLKNITRSTHHLHLLVNDILDFTKLETKKLKLDLVDSQIMMEVGELLRVHCAAALSKNLEFNFDWVPTDIKTIKIDQLRFNQIMNNILSNAIKFTAAGKIYVGMQVTEEKLIIEVTDTGQGMTEKQKENVFSPFVQADSSIGRNFGGTGLGLTIVRDLVNLMDGSIKIESQKGLGTTVKLEIPHLLVEKYENTFSKLNVSYQGDNELVNQWLSNWSEQAEHFEVTLNTQQCKKIFISDNQPLNESDADHHICLNSQISEFKRVSEGRTDLCSAPLFPDLLFETLQLLEQESTADCQELLTELSGKILVAEDNPINQMMLSKQLETMGLTSVLVSDGEAALKLLSTSPEGFSAVITDCHMPIMDGFELANRIRQEVKEFEGKPVIACTAEDARLGTEDSRLSSFDEVLYKPFKLKRLHSLLSKFLKENEDLLEQENLQGTTNTKELGGTLWLDNFDVVDRVKIAAIFFDSMRNERNKLSTESSELDVKQIAHKIKGGASVVGANELSSKAKQLETAVKENTNDTSKLRQALIETLNVELEKIENWLNTHK